MSNNYVRLEATQNWNRKDTEKNLWTERMGYQYFLCFPIKSEASTKKLPGFRELTQNVNAFTQTVVIVLT